MTDHDWTDELTSVERFSSVDGDEASRSTGDYRDYVYPHDHESFVKFRDMNVRDFATDRLASPVMLEMLRYWAALYAEPFVGVTENGAVEPGLFATDPVPDPDAANTAAMVAAAQAAISSLTSAQREAYRYDIDAPEWRAWSNPEILIHEVGVRLDEIDAASRDAILELVRVSLGPEGFATVSSVMRLNAFLGEVVDLPVVLNEFSYQTALFGEPSLTAPWGWQLFGHHLAVNVLVLGTRLVVSPVFLGAEPNRSADQGDVLFGRRQELALELMSTLTDAQRAKVVLYDSVRSSLMPEGRIRPVDERHLAGAFQDNRLIAPEGIRADDFDAAQRELLLALVEDHLALLPDGPARVRLREVAQHLDRTWFCWIGGTTTLSPFYFRIQSPVFLAEFDHHAGVWLDNQFPAVFHVHTTMRTPNGNDYGKALIEEYRRSVTEAGE